MAPSLLLQVERDLQKMLNGTRAFRSGDVALLELGRSNSAALDQLVYGRPPGTTRSTPPMMSSLHPDNPFDGWTTAPEVYRSSDALPASSMSRHVQRVFAARILFPALRPYTAAMPSVISRKTFGNGGTGQRLISLLEITVHNPCIH